MSRSEKTTLAIKKLKGSKTFGGFLIVQFSRPCLLRPGHKYCSQMIQGLVRWSQVLFLADIEKKTDSFVEDHYQETRGEFFFALTIVLISTSLIRRSFYLPNVSQITFFHSITAFGQ